LNFEAERFAEAVAIVDAQNQAENEKISVAIGERSFEGDELAVLKAAITGLGNMNLSVITLDRDLGLLVAEGASPFSTDKEKELTESYRQRLTETTGLKTVYMPGNYTLRITLNIFDTGGGVTRAKIGITSITQGESPAKGHNLSPGLFRELHREIWLSIDKELFIQSNTLGNE
jgi:hypothetical protein